MPPFLLKKSAPEAKWGLGGFCSPYSSRQLVATRLNALDAVQLVNVGSFVLTRATLANRWNLIITIGLLNSCRPSLRVREKILPRTGPTWPFLGLFKEYDD